MLSLCSALPAQQSDKSSAPASQKSTAPSEAEKTKTPLSPEEKKRADLRADTEKLYKLTQELKTEVEKSNKDTLSVSVIKKAQEIEQLAKSIRERSKNQ
jgi:hypothetical protein